MIKRVFGCFFFKQKTAYEMRISDWSSDVCSSDLADIRQHALEQREGFLLIFVDRLLLRIGAQEHDLTQRVERREMLLPMMVERLEQDRLFDPLPRLGIDEACFLGGDRVGRSEEHTSELQSLMRIS